MTVDSSDHAASREDTGSERRRSPVSIRAVIVPIVIVEMIAFVVFMLAVFEDLRQRVIHGQSSPSSGLDLSIAVVTLGLAVTLLFGAVLLVRGRRLGSHLILGVQVFLLFDGLLALFLGSEGFGAVMALISSVVLAGLFRADVREWTAASKFSWDEGAAPGPGEAPPGPLVSPSGAEGTGPVEERQLVTCRTCGLQDMGTYCSGCGRRLDQGAPLLLFIDSFLHVRALTNFVKTFQYLVRSPSRNTMALLERCSASDAFEFLAVSAGLFVVVALSSVLVVDGPVLSVVALPIYWALIYSLHLVSFYWLANRRSKKNVSFHSFLTLAALVLGLSLPIVSVYGTMFWTKSLAGYLLISYLAFPLILGIAVYQIRVWSRFWGLSPWRILVYLVVLGTLVGGVAMLFVIGLGIYHPPAVPPA